MVSVLRCCCETISSCPVISCLGAVGLAAGGAATFCLVQASKVRSLFGQCCPITQILCPLNMTTVAREAFCVKEDHEMHMYFYAGGIALAASLVLFCCAAVSCCCLRGCIPKEKEVEKGERAPLRSGTKPMKMRATKK
jgi:hypothetical protein